MRFSSKFSFWVGASILSLALWSAVQATEAPQFSGSWIFDSDSSEMPSGGLGRGRGGRGGGGRGRGGGGRGFEPPSQMEIKIVEGVIEVSSPDRRASRTLLPGQGPQSFSGPGGEGTMEAHWEDGVLVTKQVSKRETRRGQMTIERRQRWYLSEDGQTLTQEAVTKTRRGERKSKLVYHRK